MAAEVIIFFSVGEHRGKNAPLRRSQVAVMEERLFAEGCRLPTLHPGGRDGNPIDAASFIRAVPANSLEALAPEQLTLSSNVILPFKAVGFRAVILFLENRPGNTEPRLALHFSQKEFEVIRIQGHISVEIADEFVLDVLQSLATGIESMNFCGEMALLALRKIDQFDPRVLFDVAVDNACRRIGGTVVDNDPLRRKHGLAHHGLEGFLDKRFFVARRSDQNISWKSAALIHGFLLLNQTKRLRAQRGNRPL